MFLIHECSYDSENPVYQKINNGVGSMFIPEARVAKDYFRTGFYERGFLNWVYENFSDPNKEMIDIGAHIGWYTCHFAQKSKRVHSFECSPKSFNYLCANIALNGHDYKVTKYNVALGNEERLTNYYIRDPKDGGGNGVAKFEYDNVKNTPFIEVPMKKLDSFDLTNINFIKIDVEGFEKQVLEGALKTLENNNYPRIFFESWDISQEENNFPSKKLREELFGFLISNGYKILQLSHDSFLAEK
jgi:FkbM family methyltransferase